MVRDDLAFPVLRFVFHGPPQDETDETCPEAGGLGSAEGVDRFGTGRLPGVSCFGESSSGAAGDVFAVFVAGREDEVGLGADAAVPGSATAARVRDLPVGEGPLMSPGRLEGGRSADDSD